MIDPSARIHPTAELEDDVWVGAGTSVWHRAQLRAGARVGRDAIIGRDVFIDLGVTLGDRVKIQNRALVYHGVTIADDVFIGPGAVLTNDRRPRAVSPTGDLARDADWTVSPIDIATGASIGAGAIIVAGCSVGAFAMVGAGAVVTHDVPDHALVVGNPARQMDWVCRCGVRLVGLSDTATAAGLGELGPDPLLACPTCGRRYGRPDDRSGLAERPRPLAAERPSA